MTDFSDKDFYTGYTDSDPPYRSKPLVIEKKPIEESKKKKGFFRRLKEKLMRRR